jgi:PAS domain S-box-containing protein
MTKKPTYDELEKRVEEQAAEIVKLSERLKRKITEHRQLGEALQKNQDELRQMVKERTAELVSANEKLEQKIDEHKRAAESIRQSEERYRTFVDSTSDLVFLKDEHFRYILVNDAYSQYLGKKEQEIIGKTDFELLPKHLAEACRESDLNALKSRGPLVSEEWNEDRVFETQKFLVNSGNKEFGIGGYVREITERIKAKEALKSSRRT